MCALAMAMSVAVACERNGGHPAPGVRGGAGAPVPVVVGRAVRQPIPIELRAVGSVEALATVSVRARVSGEIKRVHFKEGSEVKQGALLFTIDPRPFQVALAEAEARLARDRVLLEQAKTELQRYADLVKQEYVTRQQFDQAQANVAALTASVQVDTAAVDNAELQLDYASIKAPISGRTGSLLVNAGNIVGPADAKPLVVILQTRPVYVQFTVPGRQLADIRAAVAEHKLQVAVRPSGQAATAPLLGQLEFVDNAVDRASGSIALKAQFDNADGALWPGQFVDVVLALGEQTDAVVVPTAAVQTGQQGSFVYVVSAGQTAQLRPVTVGRSVDGLTAIERGIEPDETVVVDGQLRLIPGALIAVKSASSRP
ncbi:MAG: efflux RND transporter periplasmic adaptor subunit [Deltaproteobacteria bacterium]|nr:efflux RND transporter periplasmic adaptor subunit [Deltaproteobacteria bacterium]